MAFALLGAWRWWFVGRDQAAIAESQIQRAFAEARWEERRSNPSLAWLLWVDALKDRLLKRQRHTWDPEDRLEALGDQDHSPVIESACRGLQCGGP